MQKDGQRLRHALRLTAWLVVLGLCAFLLRDMTGAAAGPIARVPPVAAEISQFGITWTFDDSYPYGQFANGDFWVAGPVTIIQISPASIIS